MKLFRFGNTAALLALLSATPFSLAAFAAAEEMSLEQGFQDPPNSARPRVWWHWINGNVSKDGIRKDLEWMKRSGIGGLQHFDVNFGVPPLVDQPLRYMTQEWKDAFRYSTELADSLELELAIAASPGWSETGGPWVKSKDGIKKLVWSETVVPGGATFRGVLAAPPETTGPFQNLVLKDKYSLGPQKPDPVYYADVAVLAYPLPSSFKTIPKPSAALGDGSALDGSALGDALFTTGVDVPNGSSEAPTTISLNYERAQTIRSATMFIPHAADMFSDPAYAPRLEVIADGRNWRKVADIKLSSVPATVSFPPVTARQFRIVLAPAIRQASQGSDAAPGYDSGVLAGLFAPPSTIHIAQLHLSPEAKVNQFEVKAGFAVAKDYYALDVSATDDGKHVSPSQVVDLTEHVSENGQLQWTPPAGSRWRMIRFGYSLTGKTNHPATEEATGLEVDKLDAGAVRDYLQTYLQQYRDVLGPELIGERGLRALLTDSTEVGAFNWTPQLLEHFRRLRGYDAKPWLPTITGVIVGSRTESDQFLYDFRRTIGELHTSEHYATIARVAHEHGLKVYGEALEGWRPSLGDDMDMRRHADYPMAAVWAVGNAADPKPIYLADMRGAASTAHLFGQSIVAAESLTSIRQPWAHAPADLRRTIDLEFASGINRLVIHTSVHQPLDDKQPGMSLRHIGQFFNRHETWASMARPWIDYIARSSYLLQQGRFAADVAYFYGEEAPTGPQTEQAYFGDVPSRYAYDFINPSAVLEVLEVDNGDLVTPAGARYRVMYLAGTSAHMSLPMLQRIAELVEAGATIVGEAPVGSPSLDDGADNYRTLVQSLWSGRGVTQVGLGRVIAGRDVEHALQVLGVLPDVDFDASDASNDVLFVHRQLRDGDIYFLHNRGHSGGKFTLRFRVSGKAPERWRADSGKIEPLSYRIDGEQTVVPLSFAANESYFVVFRTPAESNSRTVPEPRPLPVARLEGPWNVTFEADRGAPVSASFAQLVALNEHADPGIRYFSGLATYSKTFSTPANHRLGDPLLLDLGRVGELAEVRLNGQMLGVVWHAPFRLDIGSAVTAEENQLEIRVANLWVNRLIGDAQPNAEKIGFTLMPTYRADAPLRPSGLIGPVQLMIAGQNRAD